MQPALDYWITIIKGIVNKIPPKEIQLIDKNVSRDHAQCSGI